MLEMTTQCPEEYKDVSEEIFKGLVLSVPRIVSVPLFIPLNNDDDIEELIIRYGIIKRKELKKILKDHLTNDECDLWEGSFSQGLLYDVCFRNKVVGASSVVFSCLKTEDNRVLDVYIQLEAIFVINKYQNMRIGSFFAIEIGHDLGRAMLPLLYSRVARKVVFTFDADLYSFSSEVVFDKMVRAFSSIKETCKTIQNCPDIEIEIDTDFEYAKRVYIGGEVI